MLSGKKLYWTTNRWLYRLANLNSQEMMGKEERFINMFY